MEKERQPGTARFGNFINYYSFNPPNKRLDFIPDTSLQEILSENTTHVLDIGCNSGDLTLMMYEKFFDPSKPIGTEHHGDVKILGVDLDATLISRCVTSNKYPMNISFKQCDIMRQEDRKSALDQYMKQNQIDQFDIVCCFSITMWIHLNHGDEALREFLRFISNVSRYILVEPQGWQSYKNAVRRMKRSGCQPFPLFETLEWKEDIDQRICDYLCKECGLVNVKYSDNLNKTHWNRSVMLYKQKSL